MEEFLYFLERNKVNVEFIETSSSKTVEESSKYVPVDLIVKTLVFIDSNNNPFALILLGKDKADFKKIKKFLNVKDVRLANDEEVFNYSGFKVGAVVPIFFKKISTVLLDKKVLDKEYVYSGGGRENLLMKISVKDIIRLTNCKIGDFSK
ncbi:MAG: YbaK/EbsC family protein [Candidatus Aenigmatarchaeota archaeon]